MSGPKFTGPMRYGPLPMGMSVTTWSNVLRCPVLGWMEPARRITRDAGSAYKLDGKDLGARDVQMLFADASTGSHSPALVRQGQISELINAKPKARRRILLYVGVAGLVCLGYPFHPPGKPERLRIEHLRALRTPALVCQGERDRFGRREEVDRYPLAPGIRLFWLPDGDHGFKPRKASGESGPENLQRAADAIAGFLGSLGGASPGQG